MKNTIRTVVATLAAAVGLNAQAATYYAQCRVESVPAGKGRVCVYQSAVLQEKNREYMTGSDETGVKSGKSPGKSVDVYFYGYCKPVDGVSEFLGWNNSVSGDEKMLSTKDEIMLKITAASTDESAPTKRTVYARYHVHAKGYVANGLTIEYKCTNVTSTCKNSCGSSSATLVAADSKAYDGQPYEASVEGASEATIAFFSGAEKLAGAPSAQGDYVVKMTYGDVTVSKNVKITHAHAWTQNAPQAGALDTTTWTCGSPDCAVGVPTVKLSGAGRAYDGTAIAFAVEKSKDFDTLVKGVTVGEVAYYLNGEKLAGAPKSVGDYVAKATVGAYALEKSFTITQAAMSGVTATLKADSFDYTAGEQEVSVASALLGAYGLTADDYEVGGLTKATGSGYSNETYKVILTGKGNFSGTQTIEWTIKAPTGAFVSCERSAAAVGGTLADNVLTLTNGCDYVYEGGKWTAGLKVTYPTATTTEFTQPKHALFTAGGETFTAAEAPTNGVSCETGKFIYSYLKSFTFQSGFTAAELEAAATKDIVRPLTACALVWSEKGVISCGDPDGVKATDFAIVAKTGDLVLPLAKGQTHDLGDTQLANVRICLAEGATVTSKVIQTPGRIFTDAPENSVSYDAGEGFYTYKVVPHDHRWTWTRSSDGSSLTAACSVAGCAYAKAAVSVAIGPKTVAEKYCDQIPLEAQVTGGAAFADVTGATVGEITYKPALSGQPGGYSAFAEVVSADGKVTNVLTTVLTILTGQAITNGIHVADMATYLELKTQDDMTILVGKDFTASKQFVVPASWKAETLTEVDLTIQQFIAKVKAGAYSDLIAWSDVQDLLAGRVTVQELAARLKDFGTEVTLLDCGAKTLDLNGFTVTAAEGVPFLRNLGQLVITGEGTMVTNGCGTLLVNEGTLSIEGGRYVGALANEGALVISGGYFTGAIANAGAGTVVLTGGTYEIKPDKDFVAAGYDLVRRGGLYYVEKHEHRYTFLPLGKSLISCTCWNWFVEDPDQLIQFSNCGAHKLGVFFAGKDPKTGVLPTHEFAWTGKPVEVGVVGYNYSALAKVGVLRNLEELVDIVEMAAEAEENWETLTPLEKIKKMMLLVQSIDDLDLDIGSLVWDQEKVAEETGLTFGEVRYYDAATDEELPGAPSDVGTYRARIVVTTPKGNDLTCSWKFSIGTAYTSDLAEWLDEFEEDHGLLGEALSAAYDKMVEELKEFHDRKIANRILEKRTTLAVEKVEASYARQGETETDVDEAHGALKEAWEAFCDDFEREWKRCPRKDEIENLFDKIDTELVAWFEERRENHEPVDQAVVDAHEKMVARLRAFGRKVSELAEKGVSEVKEWIGRRRISEADLADAERSRYAKASLALDRELIQATDAVKLASVGTEDGDLVLSVTINGETVKSANIADMIEETHDLAKQEWAKAKKAVTDVGTGKVTVKPAEGAKSVFVRVNIPADN